jgi:hypothetical protein
VRQALPRPRRRLARVPCRILVALTAALTGAGGLARPAAIGAAPVERCLFAPVPPRPDLEADPWLPLGMGPVPAPQLRELRRFLEETGLASVEEIRAKLARLGYDAGTFLDRAPVPPGLPDRPGGVAALSRRRLGQAARAFEREHGLGILAPFSWSPALHPWVLLRPDKGGLLRRLDRALAERRVPPEERSASPTAVRRCPV